MSDNNDGIPDDSRDRNEKNTGMTRRQSLKAAGAIFGGAGVLSESVSASSQNPSNVLTIWGDRGRADYEFTVSGTLKKNPTIGSIHGHDVVDGSTATGLVDGGIDSYHFSGEITDFSLSSAATVLLDGVEVDPRTLGTNLTHSLTIWGDQGRADYEFTVSGDLTKNPAGGSVHDHDAVDGSTATGLVDGGIDSYHFSGEITDFSLSSPATVYVDGQEVDPATLPSTGSAERIEFSVASDGESYTAYAIEVSATGPPVAVTDDGDVDPRLRAEDDHRITKIRDGQYRIQGQTRTPSDSRYPHGDTFRWETTQDGWGVLGFSYSGATEANLDITIDDGTVSPSELPEAEADPEVNVGGGDGYYRTISRSEADYVATTERELRNALSSATSGDAVFVPGDVVIDFEINDVTADGFTVPPGVTLASDRGVGGSDGALLRPQGTSNWTTGWPLATVVWASDGARVTGIRVEGPHPGHKPYSNSDILEMGVDARHSTDVEIDNCEIWGFRYTGVRAGEDTYIHHNDVHNCAYGGMGYCVHSDPGQPVIEYNYFNYYRHAVMNDGAGGYVCRYNVFGPDTMGHVIDVHEPGGIQTQIHHNTVQAAVYHDDATASWYPSGDDAIQVMIRGTPEDVADIHHNWFANANDPASEPETGVNGSAIVQNGPDEWTNLTFLDNHYGSSEPSLNVGHVR